MMLLWRLLNRVIRSRTAEGRNQVTGTKDIEASGEQVRIRLLIGHRAGAFLGRNSTAGIQKPGRQVQDVFFVRIVIF